ncbi:hypothetical protein L1887_51585 [Cichorium endivia]|nr:hypothetical protein L1887_51585 [Cichorium endivia]
MQQGVGRRMRPRMASGCTARLDVAPRGRRRCRPLERLCEAGLVDPLPLDAEMGDLDPSMRGARNGSGNRSGDESGGQSGRAGDGEANGAGANGERHHAKPRPLCGECGCVGGGDCERAGAAPACASQPAGAARWSRRLRAPQSGLEHAVAIASFRFVDLERVAGLVALVGAGRDCSCLLAGVKVQVDELVGCKEARTGFQTSIGTALKT